MKGSFTVDTAAKCWLLKHVFTPMLMGTANLLEEQYRFLVTKAVDPFLDGAKIIVHTKQAPQNKGVVTPFIEAFRVMAADWPLVLHAVNTARGQTLETLEDLMECQLYNLMKAVLQLAGCNVKSIGKKNEFAIQGRPHLLALAMCTNGLQKNLISVFDGIADREAFCTAPPPVTSLLMKALDLYVDLGLKCAAKLDVPYDMPAPLLAMKERLSNWHEHNDSACITHAGPLSRDDISWEMEYDESQGLTIVLHNAEEVFYDMKGTRSDAMSDGHVLLLYYQRMILWKTTIQHCLAIRLS